MEGGDDLLRLDNALAAESWASHTIAGFNAMRDELRSRREEAPPFEEMVLDRCRTLRNPQARVVAAALAAVAPPQVALAARAAAATLTSVQAPAWIASIGTWLPTAAWVAADVYRDQESLIVGFADPGDGQEHTFVVLIDHNLSGQAKDAWQGGDTADMVAKWRDEAIEAMVVEEITVDEALDKLHEALAVSDLFNGDSSLRTEDFDDNRALLWARLARTGRPQQRGSSSEDTTPSEEQQRALARDFLASPEAAALASVPEAAELADQLIMLRSMYEGRPLRWSPIVVEVVLTDLAPRKLMLSRAGSNALPEVLKVMVRWAGRMSGLEDRWVAETVAAVDRCARDFRRAARDPGAAGPAKLMAAALAREGIDLDDEHAVQALVDRVNEAGGIDSLLKPAPRKPPPTAPAAIAELAEATPVLQRFGALAEFYATARKVTPKGNPTVADTRELVELLGLQRDEFFGTDPVRNADDMPELKLMLRWALAAGVLRKANGKVAATATWQKLNAKPAQRWVRAAEALTKIGPTADPEPGWVFDQLDELTDEHYPALLSQLREGPVPFEDFVDDVLDAADVRFQFHGYLADRDRRRESFERSAHRLLAMLQLAGIAEREGAETVAHPVLPERTKLVRGDIVPTELARWWLS